MTNKLLLVDFENVQQDDFSRLDKTYTLVIFVEASQKIYPLNWLQMLKSLVLQLNGKKLKLMEVML